jgi:hypothetical protein
MPTTNRRDNPAEAIRLALIGLDAQIADLWETRAKLVALIDQPPTGSAVKMAEPRKRRLSAEAKAKISAAAKARWARERRANTKTQKPKKAAKKTQSKAKTSKTQPAPAKAKKSPAKKGKSKLSTPAVETKLVKVA